MSGKAVARVKQALADAGCLVRGNSAQCPAHDDQNPSLSIGQGDKGALVYCQAGCSTDEVLEALGMSAADLFDTQRQPAWTITATYTYTDEWGRPLYYVERRQPKAFRQYRIVSGRKVYGLGDMMRVPYHLPALLDGIAQGRTIHIVEGEKDVHAVEADGGVATCNPMGAGKWRDEYRGWFADAKVVIVADRDPPGRAHAAQIAASLRFIAATTRVVEAAAGKDAADHLAAGYTLDDFRDPEPPEGPPDSEPPGDASTARMTAIAAAYTPIDWATLLSGDQPPPVRWLIEPVLEAGTVNALFSKVGTGKSLLSLDWAVCLARAGITVMYVDEENPQVFIGERARAFGASIADLSARLPYYSFASLPPLDTAEGGEHLEALAVCHGAALVILDTTARMVRGGENDADTFVALYRCALVPLKKRGITVLRLDHPGKDESKGQRGSSAKEGDVDTIWRLTEVQPNQRYRLARLKNRSGHAPEFGELEIRRHHQPELRHEVETAVARAVLALDKLGVLPNAGRPACGQALRAAGYTVGNDVLDQAIRVRKDGAKLPGANWGIGGP